MRRYLSESLIVFGLLLLTAFVYWPVLENDFVYWDDNVEIYANPHLKGITAEALRWMFCDTGYVVRYQPLAWLTWSIVYELFGRQPIGYHLASLLFHCLNTGLVFLLIRKLLLLVQPEGLSRPKYNYLLVCAGLGTLLWALHPLRVETVAWASAFLHCQALLFLLAAGLCYLEAAEPEPTDRRRRVFYWVSVGSFAVSLLSYPIGLAFVVIIVVLDFYPLKRLTGLWWQPAARQVWLEKLPFAVVACLVLGITLLLRFNTSSQWARPVTLAQFGMLSRIMQAGYVWAFYLWKPWVPFHLSPVYTTLVSFNPASAPFLLSLALVVGMSVLLAWRRQQWPAALALWVCHLVWLVPVLGLTEQPHYANDRYSLVTGIFLSILCAAVLLELWEQRVRRALGLGMVVLATAFLAGLSARQIGIWRNSLTLFEYMIARLGNDPYRADIYWRLGVVQMEKGAQEKALESFNRSLEINPDDFYVHRLVASHYYKLGRFEEARNHYEAALRGDPRNAELLNGLGAVVCAQGDWVKASEYFSHALQLNPNLSSANFNMGLALANLGKKEEAMAYFQKAERLTTAEPAPKN